MERKIGFSKHLSELNNVKGTCCTTYAWLCASYSCELKAILIARLGLKKLILSPA